MSPRLLALATLLLLNAAAIAGSPSWFREDRLTPQASRMMEVLARADEYGMRVDDYTLDMPRQDLDAALTGTADTEQRSRFDQALTLAVTRFVTHVSRGRVAARSAGFNLPVDGSAFAPARIAEQLATAADVDALLACAEPRPRPYALLKTALARYRALAREPGLTELPALPGQSIQTGDAYAGAMQLRTLLVALGDLDAAAVAEHRNESSIDASLADAVRDFQNRHGLERDGRIGRATFTALTTPLSHRVRQIELALERWRWLSALPRPDIVVNIPQFMLYALPRPNEPDARVIEMPVIVGRSHTRTPVFAADITEVIFQPFWDVPSSIVRKELLPRIRKDPSFLTRNQFEIVRGAGETAAVVAPTPAAIDALAAGRLRLRQRPGPLNALGPVKFVLPNPYDVRLHGTPEQQLFEQSRRAFSHGCVRVSEPAALAEYVLRNARDKWDAASIDAAICGTQTIHVRLEAPVRIVVFYVTAAATESRGMLFSDDIYGHDRRLQRLLGDQGN